jgi:hypothetical protein
MVPAALSADDNLGLDRPGHPARLYGGGLSNPQGAPTVLQEVRPVTLEDLALGEGRRVVAFWRGVRFV